MIQDLSITHLGNLIFYPHHFTHASSQMCSALFLCKLFQLLHLCFHVTPYLYVELIVTLIDLAGHSSNLTSQALLDS